MIKFSFFAIIDKEFVIRICSVFLLYE